MKKKAIEQIPYLTVRGTIKDKKVRYIAVTACKIIGHEKHIFLEVYRNRKKNLKIPVVRYVATKKDYGVYLPESEEWTRQRILNTFTDQLCWHVDGDSRRYDDRRQENRLYSDKDYDRIKTFFKNIRVYEKDDWWDYFTGNESNIRHDAYMRKYQRRQDALKERGQNTPPLPEKELLAWADKALFHEEHFLYYRKHGRKAAVCCSKCGGVTDAAWKPGESYESRFEKTIEEPRDGQYGHCPLCGARGIYKAKGKVRSLLRKKAYTFMADRYKETSAVIRYVGLEKTWVLEEFIGESGQPEMHGAYEKLTGGEIARTYFEPDKKPQTDFHKYNSYTGGDFWDDCNLSGINNITISEARLYPASAQNLKGTILQYSAIDLYEAAVGKVNAKEYMERYRTFPQIEMLVKLRLYGVVNEMVRCRCGIIRDQNAKRPEAFLGIRREKLPLLVRRQGDIRLLRALQMEKNLGQSWTDRQCDAMCEINVDRNNISLALQFMTIQKFMNRIEKYAGCRFLTDCGTAHAQIMHVVNTYLDYLSMRQQLGYDLNNTVYQYPRDLNAAHNALVEEMDAKRLDQRMAEVAQRFPAIRAYYRKLRNKYFYEDDAYIIRPARSAEEIVKEGRTLHHCVGGDNYLTKHNEQKSIILMLRFKTSPDVPYITVEIKDTTICQWYGAHDKKPDEKNMQKWLDRYVTLLRCGQTGTGMKKERVRIPVPVMTA